MSLTSFEAYQDRNRRENARYARGRLDRLMDDIGDADEGGIFDRLKSLVGEMRDDGFTDAAFHATQALPLLQEAETHLERAKGKLA